MLLKSFLLKMYYLGKCQFFFFNWVTLIFRDKLFHYCFGRWSRAMGKPKAGLQKRLREQRGEIFYDISKV